MTFRAVPGTRIGDYVVASEIGRGGMAVVYLAEHPNLGRKVALKLLADKLSDDHAFRDRFMREARLAAGIEHPNIVPIYDAGEVEGLLFIAMRYVEGIDLGRLIEREQHLSLARTQAIVSQVAAALDAAHARGLVHRDVKPSNVLLGSGEGPGGTDHAYLADFGLARPQIGSDLTQAGELYGTLDYMAPEQFDGRPLDARTDIYALSCVAYECLTGEPPFRKESSLAKAAAHLGSRPVPPSELNPELSSGVDQAIMRGLMKEKSDRPSLATHLARALAETSSSSGQDVASASPLARVNGAVEPPERIDRSRRAGRGRRGRWMAAIATAAATALIGLFIALRDPTTPPPETTNLLRVDPLSSSITNTIADGFERLEWPGTIWFTGPTLWQATDEGLLQRDAATGAIQATRPLPTSWEQAVGGLGSVWVTTFDGPDTIVHQIDPVSGETLATTRVAGKALDIALGSDAIWIITSERLLARINPLTGKAETKSKIAGDRPSLVVAVGRDVWIGDDAALKAYRFDQHLERVSQTIDLQIGEFIIDVGDPNGETLWVVDPTHGTLIPLDAHTGARGEPVGVGGRIWDAKVVGSTIWVAAGSVVTEIELLGLPAHHPIEIPGPTSAGAIAIDDSGQYVWVENCGCPRS